MGSGFLEYLAVYKVRCDSLAQNPEALQTRGLGVWAYQILFVVLAFSFSQVSGLVGCFPKNLNPIPVPRTNHGASMVE